MKLTRREAILLAHLTNLSTNALMDMLIKKGYTKQQAKELLNGDGERKDCSMSLWHKTGQKIDVKLSIYGNHDPLVK